MAKKKSRKTNKDKKPSYLVELYGIGLILVAILGIGKYGFAGRAIASFSLFLVGNLYFFLLITLFIIGIIIIVNRKGINFLSSKMIGIYLFVIGLVVLMHQNYVMDNINTSKVFTETIDYLMLGIEKIMNKSVQVGIFNQALSNTGGGLFGAIFASIFYGLFDAEGTKVVVWVLLISGFMIFTGLSIKDIFDKGKETVGSLKPKKGEKLEKVKDNSASDEPKIVDHNDEKLVVHDIKELTKVKTDVKKEVGSMPLKESDNVNKSYVLPSIELLAAPKKSKKATDHTVIEKNIETLEQVLRDFDIRGKVVEVNIGPTVTQYELSLSSGTRVSKLLTINKEISLALAKKDVRIQAPIPGKSTVGIEMPNDSTQAVTIRETLEQMPSSLADKPLAVALGKDIMGKVRWCEIDKTPHLLVA